MSANDDAVARARAINDELAKMPPDCGGCQERDDEIARLRTELREAEEERDEALLDLATEPASCGDCDDLEPLLAELHLALFKVERVGAARPSNEKLLRLAVSLVPRLGQLEDECHR